VCDNQRNRALVGVFLDTGLQVGEISGIRWRHMGAGHIDISGKVGDGRVQPRPEPACIVVQPQFSFGILIEPLDYPPVVGQNHLLLEGPGVQAPGQEVFGLSLMPI